MIGKTVSHYRILEKLGGGGMGVVYKAEDTLLQRTVALKFLPPELTGDEDSKKRFIHEARAASALDHPNICNIHEIGETQDGQLFICMAFYEGETLKKKIRQGPMSVRHALDIGINISRGLVKAHSHDIIHRDIKSANIMITDEGEVKIVDFGLAKLTGRTQLTKTGSTIGTIAYMSPEHMKHEKIDARSDVFSLGVVLYELLTGRLPFGGDNEAAIVYAILNKDPEPLARFRNDIPAELQQVMDKTLQKDVEKRYQTAGDLENDLQRLLDGLLPVLPKRILPYRVRRFGVPAGIALAVFVALALIPRSRHAITGLLRGPSAEKQIVVLPFANVGNGPSDQAFCDGLMETLTSQLTLFEQFHELFWVVPASEVRSRGVASPSEAHRVFGVNLVISGGLQRFNNKFRVTLNLIEVSNPDAPRQIASSVIDDLMANIAILQDDAVIKTADMLGLELVPESRKMLAAGSTGNSEAYGLYLEGRGYLQRFEKEGNIDQAIRLFERATALDSLYALAYAGLGEAYVKKYRITMDTQWVGYAVTNGMRAVELNDQLVPALVTLGMIYRETGEYEKSIAELKQVLTRDPTSADACQELASSYAAAGMLEEAESTYQRSIQLRPAYWGGCYSLGVFYWQNDRPDEAVRQFQRVVELTPDNMWGYNSLGAAYYSLERWDEAHSMFERSIESQPNYRAYANLGTLDYVQKRYADAAAMYEKALELNNTSYITWGSLANAYYWLPERRNEAYPMYRRAAELAEEQREVNPKNPRLLTSLAGYYAMIGEEDKAMALTAQALELEPDNSRIAYFAGFTYEQLGKRDEAIEWIGKALNLGYSISEVESDPWLEDLRSDGRFQQLLQDARNKQASEHNSK